MEIILEIRSYLKCLYFFHEGFIENGYYWCKYCDYVDKLPWQRDLKD